MTQKIRTCRCYVEPKNIPPLKDTIDFWHDKEREINE